MPFSKPLWDLKELFMQTENCTKAKKLFTIALPVGTGYKTSHLQM